MAIVDAARSFAARVARQLVRVTVLDMATRLAAQAFLAALPMLIAVASFCPTPVRHEMRRSLHTLVGADGAVVAQLDTLTDGGDAALHSWGAVGVLVALVSATSFTRALQRMCERSWELPRSGVRYVAWRWAVWLMVWIVMLVLQGSLHRAFGAGAALGVVLQLADTVLMWWWTQHLLLAGRVPWPPLLPGALLTGAGVVAYCSASALWLPRALRMSEQRYGALGSVFTLLSWLIVFFTVVVGGVAIGRVLAQEELVRRWLGAGPGPGDASP
ncbi:YhjD/YihY/BrkB family envelope integrity protein [Streptomyces sp. VRA16 Mangrove soil]|uniref:YhjD/YihY/BrkB family envelope integrity protein n=1 Tax=Streptomyces sp. VRA16 Mangrove soil TaxID=2817434 RepID=UPI001A9D4EE6|nr:YhjD/YihY/BrkB family envelope integrity protein [Streptomyces sp. VRA16 Mangrove soil]MBO1332130.1 YihY/virulence factor BrkB family protein [Streptomyces sp. VRA16 Mangrove soil]